MHKAADRIKTPGAEESDETTGKEKWIIKPSIEDQGVRILTDSRLS